VRRDARHRERGEDRLLQPAAIASTDAR